MARKKTTKKTAEEAPVVEAPVEAPAEEIEAEAPVEVEKPVEKAVTVEVVDLDRELEEVRATTGFGIQAYMRDAIANATRKNH